MKQSRRAGPSPPWNGASLETFDREFAGQDVRSGPALVGWRPWPDARESRRSTRPLEGW